MPAYQLVIFDCDGVLVDSEPIANRVLVEAVATLGLGMERAEADEMFLGHTMPECVRLLEERLGHALDARFLVAVETRTRTAFERELAPVPGVREVLAALRVPAAVASNSSRSGLRRKLAHTGLLAHFAGRLYSFEDVARPKPHPDVYLLAARNAGVEPARCVVVEDSPTGVAAGRAAGMPVLGYTAGGDGARLRAAGAEPFASMANLYDLLELRRHARR